MTNGQIRDLCIGLLNADSEDEVVALLSAAGFWDDEAAWRHYGDVENNWGTGGNQQSLAEAALVEKIVNSVDARLINECLVRGIDPKGDKAPRSIREAVSKFFGDDSGASVSLNGFDETWLDAKVREVAQGITLCATGTKPTLNLTISDCGEGQTPKKIPTTILSLNKSNKLYVPFVQGQFNQGGTGALRFCGNHNIQLVVSRRNPKLLGPDPDESDSNWGFTVVRRERPAGGRRNSIYTYLAPVGVGESHHERKGEVLSFTASTMKLFPDKDAPYGRESGHGTAIKLFDYKYLGERSNIIRGRSILSRLDLLLPEVALPVRLYEFRKGESGKYLDPGSRETTLAGLRRRLNNTPNVEDEFPITIPFAPAGEQLFATVYAFKEAGSSRNEDQEDEESAAKKKLGGLTRYRKREGVLFVRNGQTQGTLPKDFFRRDQIKLKTIADDLLVFVDCEKMSDPVREDLFMPSRDRLTENDFKGELIDGLEQALKNDETLRQLRNRRQQEQMTEQMKDDKPLAEVLRQLIRSSPNLTALLQLGQRIPAPFNLTATTAHDDKPFKGEVYPKFFKVKNVPYGQLHKRDCPINYLMRLSFETDARDDYFSRRIEPGSFSLVWQDKSGTERSVSTVGPSLRRGVATVTVTLPEGVQVGDTVNFIARTKDTRNEFVNRIDAVIRPAAEHRDHGSNERNRKNPDNKKDGKDRDKPRELATPKIERVYRDQWARQKPPFDEHTAMRMGTLYDEQNNEFPVFYINLDNTPLLNEIKQRRLDETAARNQFLFGNVLVGLSLLLQDKEKKETAGSDVKKDTGGSDEKKKPMVEEQIETLTNGLAPFMLSLTSLSREELSEDEPVDGLDAATG